MGHWANSINGTLSYQQHTDSEWYLCGILTYTLYSFDWFIWIRAWVDGGEGSGAEFVEALEHQFPQESLGGPVAQRGTPGGCLAGAI